MHLKDEARRRIAVPWQASVGHNMKSQNVQKSPINEIFIHLYRRFQLMCQSAKEFKMIFSTFMGNSGMVAVMPIGENDALHMGIAHFHWELYFRSWNACKFRCCSYIMIERKKIVGNMHACSSTVMPRNNLSRHTPIESQHSTLHYHGDL